MVESSDPDLSSLYAVEILGSPKIIRMSRYSNFNPKLMLYSADESQIIMTLTQDLPRFTTRAADADYAFNRVHALMVPDDMWLKALEKSRLIKLTGDVFTSPKGAIYAYVAHLLFIHP